MDYRCTDCKSTDVSNYLIEGGKMKLQCNRCGSKNIEGFINGNITSVVHSIKLANALYHDGFNEDYYDYEDDEDYDDEDYDDEDYDDEDDYDDEEDYDDEDYDDEDEDDWDNNWEESIQKTIFDVCHETDIQDITTATENT